MSSSHFDIPYGRAICYSGYREGQDPRSGKYPSHSQVLEDLKILQGNWDYLRLYDSSPHAEIVLSLIKQEQLNFKVLLGMDLAAEMSNPGCPWNADYSDDQLKQNYQRNQSQLENLIRLADLYDDCIFAVSIGNEASVDWTDHLVSVDRLIEIAKAVRANSNKPITFCENYVPWLGKLDALVPHLDFLSIHTYPAWEYVNIEEALSYSINNYWQVADRHNDKPVIITEAGWATRANGRGMDPWNASEDLQKIYTPQLDEWSANHQVLTFMFEAFDEPWKGSDDINDPEKHWGFYYEDRSPKPVAALFKRNNQEDEVKETSKEHHGIFDQKMKPITP